MSRKVIAIFLMLALVLLYIPVSSGETQENQGVSKSRYIIGLTSHADEGIISMITGVGGKPKHDFGKMNVISADLPDSAVNGLLHNPRIEYIRPAVLVHASEETLDWGVDKIDADLVWGSGVKGAGVKVAIIDTGIDRDHEDLATNIVDGWNAIVPGNDYDDDNGHGTHCAGIVAAIDNDIGVIGVAPEADIYGVKALDSNGSGWSDDIAAGIYWAVDVAKVDIISMSLGSDSPMSLIELASNYANDNGVLVFAAAGNDYKNMRRNTVDYPGAYASVIAVAATTSSDTRAYFSSTGSQVELAAPGYEIYSTVIGSYGYKSGTSMATPMAVGVAALVMSADPTLSNDEVRFILGETAVDLGSDGRDIEFGFGRVDAKAAVESLSVDPPPVDDTPPTVTITEPTDGSSVSGTVTLSATATDNVGIANVEFFSDIGGSIGSDSIEPYSVEWVTTADDNGIHNLTAVAIDTSDNSTTSIDVIVTINNEEPPVIELTAEVVMEENIRIHPVKGTGTAEATVTVTDGDGNLVSGVLVEGHWVYGVAIEPGVSGVTNDLGVVIFKISKVEDPLGYEFTVDNMTN